MNPVEKDDFIHALGQTLTFYSKKLDTAQASFWLTALEGFTWRQIRPALLEYMKVGRYAPKPVDIIELIEQQREQAPRQALPPAPERPRCPEEVARAWSYWIPRFWGDTGVMRRGQDAPVDEADAMLLLVNREAKRYGQPDAIPDNMKLEEVWR